MKKRILAGILSAGILITAASYSFVWANEEEITVKLNGNVIDFDVNPEIIDGRTMVPLRKIFEEIGAFVKWDNDTQTVSARKSSKTVTLKINSNDLQIDRGEVDADGNAVTEVIELDVPPQIVSDRTLVPTRAVSEAFGLDVDWNEETNTVSIDSKSDSDDSWKNNTGEINLDSLSYTENDGIEISENQILITQGGDYTLTGTLSDGNVTVNTEDKVKLRLNGVNITSSLEPCIYIENADKAYITISDGTENNLNAKNSEKGAVYSKDNLEIKGNGALNIESAVGHGIKASDNLTIENGNINITAEKDAVNINDTFKMTGGTLKTTSVGDGIASDSIVEITGGTVNITTTAEPTEENKSDSEQTSEQKFRGPEAENKSADFAESSKGIKAEWMMCISGGDITVNSADHAIHCADEIEITGGKLNISSEYGKGISAHGNFTIDGSDTVIDILKSVEGLESKNIMTINDGTISIISSDDGINATGGNSGAMLGQPNMGGHGDMNNQGNRRDDRFNNENSPMQNEGMMPLEFDNENMQGQMPPEKGPEGEKNNFGQGDFNPFDGSAEPPKHNDDKSRRKDCLVINGGYIEVYAEDDCLDSNGNLILNGGIIKATKTDGSFKGNFGIFDPDGALEISEGVTIVAACLKGEEQTLDIPQNNIILYCDERHSADDTIVLKDKNGNAIIEYSPKGDYQAVLITSPELKNGDYSISVGSEQHDITVTEKNTVLGERTNTGFGNGGFGNGGFRNDRQREQNIQ